MTANPSLVKQQRLELRAIDGVPAVDPGDDVAKILLNCLHDSAIALEDDDVLVIAQKIISKAENRYAFLNQVTPSERAKEIAQEVDKDPRLVELILDESVEVLRQRPGVIIVEHKHGYVHANAGIDRSNISCDDDDPSALLLPEDPDLSAQQLRDSIKKHTGKNVAIIINDSAGRAWRNGTIGFAIGTSGFEPVVNLVGNTDLFGNELKVTEVAIADELAAAASFLMGQADEGQPAVLIRGAKLPHSDQGSRSLIRDRQYDMFR